MGFLEFLKKKETPAAALPDLKFGGGEDPFGVPPAPPDTFREEILMPAFEQPAAPSSVVVPPPEPTPQAPAKMADAPAIDFTLDTTAFFHESEQPPDDLSLPDLPPLAQSLEATVETFEQKHHEDRASALDVPAEHVEFLPPTAPLQPPSPARPKASAAPERPALKEKPIKESLLSLPSELVIAEKTEKKEPEKRPVPKVPIAYPTEDEATSQFIEARAFYALLQDVRGLRASVRAADAITSKLEEDTDKEEDLTESVFELSDGIQEQLITIDTELFE